MQECCSISQILVCVATGQLDKLIVALAIKLPDLNFQSQDSGLSNSQSRDWRSTVKTTKIATWATVFGSLFLN